MKEPIGARDGAAVFTLVIYVQTGFDVSILPRKQGDTRILDEASVSQDEDDMKTPRHQRAKGMARLNRWHPLPVFCNRTLGIDASSRLHREKLPMVQREIGPGVERLDPGQEIHDSVAAIAIGCAPRPCRL